MHTPIKGLLRTAAAALLLAGMSLAAHADPFRLIVTHLEPPLVPNSVMDLAVELGYFKREGVDVELVRVQQTPSAIAAIQSGEGEMANIGLDALSQLVATGTTDLKAVVSPNKSLPYLIASKDSITTTADLAGKSFGIGRPGSLDHSLSSRVLTADGVDLAKVDFVAIGQPDIRIQALAAGQIDATTVSIGVWQSLPDKTGLHILVSQDDYYAAAPVINKVNIVSQKALEERHDDVVKVITALVKISRDFAKDPSKWVDAIAPFQPNVSRADLETLAASFAKSWSVNGGMSAKELQYSTDWLYQTEDFKDLKPVEMSSWADLSLVGDVLKSLGTDASMDAP
ncbi:MAG: ABC-type nitrate/sulfonate/bicarbonate transport system, periplasmic component [Devosia sp.]|uniref:ABC transporter substrate-binding protein n=1 Tax=Devosia sp. TaxID=1871048 RepID=UPI002637DF10|nr:ABC transporter substrate-binding protein [Devosia sp.]MDB5587733.1 ABC-type nitrate/sulfonate/bicarbonate transport system, periplasmic component [Devosia sp.]